MEDAFPEPLRLPTGPTAHTLSGNTLASRLPTVLVTNLKPSIAADAM